MRHAKRQERAQHAAEEKKKRRSRTRHVLSVAGTLLFVALLSYGGYQGLTHPATPLPAAWNPIKPLLIGDPVTPLTTWKLNRATSDLQSCVAALQDHAAFKLRDDLEDSDQCHIRDRVELAGIGGARLANVKTRCAIALRLAMWEQHGLQPAAQALLGSDLTRIEHFGSYSCRQMRTAGGLSSRMSTHATANAIDIAGFALADGRTIRLIDDWEGSGPEAAFLRAARDSACGWFRLTLSPDYNALHADHFHLQSTGWGLCR